MRDLESQSELCVFNVTKKDRIHRSGDTIQRTEQENDLANSGKVVFAGAGRKDMAGWNNRLCTQYFLNTSVVAE